MLLNVNSFTLASFNSSAPQKNFLKDISFSVNHGEIVAIIGPNGAGKSTLLNTISGDITLSKKNGLDVLFNDISINTWNLLERSKQLAYLTQSSPLNFPYTVTEVVALGRTPHSTGLTIDNQIIDHVINELDIGHLRNRFYTQLSGGEKQRTHLARVFAQLYVSEDLDYNDQNKPYRLLMLDEPITGLDLAHKHGLMDAVKRLTSKNIGVLLVIHDFSFAAQYADKVLILNNGEMAAFGVTNEIMTKPLLEEVFNKEVFILEHPQTKKPIIVG